jgi:aminopeptidase N
LEGSNSLFVKHDTFSTLAQGRATNLLFVFLYCFIIMLHLQVWDQFVLSELSRAQSLDALKSSHPIEVEVMNASDTNDIFDAISYAKVQKKKPPQPLMHAFIRSLAFLICWHREL